MEPNTEQNLEQNKSSVGSVVGTIIIIAIIVLGGLYFWGKRIEETKPQNNLFQTSEESSLPTTTDVNNSDELMSIEAELNATDLNNDSTAELE